MVILFAIGTYYDETNPLNVEDFLPEWIKVTEIILINIMTADYFVFFFLSENRIYYLFDYYSIVGYISIIPAAMVRYELVVD